MCNQTVSLIAAELERHGIVTVSIQLLRAIAEQVRPPRSLVVPFRHGFPLGSPNDPVRQHEVIEAALRMLEDVTVSPPALIEFHG
jgi:D-proline reductase (dithiol) PrdB